MAISNAQMDYFESWANNKSLKKINFYSDSKYYEKNCKNTKEPVLIVHGENAKPSNANEKYENLNLSDSDWLKLTYTSKIGRVYEIVFNCDKPTETYSIANINGLDNNPLFTINSYAENVSATVSKRNLKVLVIEVDPVLTKGTVNGRNCVGMKASEALNQNSQQDVNELIEDIEYSSHGIIDVDIVKTDKYDGFPKLTKNITLSNGTVSNKLDEDTWLDIMKNGWWGFWDNSYVQQFGSWTFDYNDMIEKHNLVERRNNNEFDQVWLVTVDPNPTYESIMVGKTSYWINGANITKNCPNFKIMNVSISRPDTNFECFGHASECIMQSVFGSSHNMYSSNSVSINASNYNNLNLWDKFILNENANSTKNTGLLGAGNVHFSPNSTSDYDWNNRSVNVCSKWQEWENYPNLTNDTSTTVFSPTIYLNNRPSGTNSDARLHHRWWFGLFPHVSGVTKNGYSNNWWDYVYTMDYVTQVTSLNSTYSYRELDKINNVQFKVKYQSGKEETVTVKNMANNVSFSNESIVRYDNNNQLVAYSKGQTTITYWRDGRSASSTIKIK